MITANRILPACLLYAAFLFTLWPLHAQQQGVINPRVEVQRDFEGHIVGVTKPKLPILIPDSISQFNISMDYTIFDKPYHDLYSFSPLPSVHLSSPKITKQPFAYLRLGTLWKTTPEGDLLVQAPLSGMSALLLSAQHRSFWGSLPRFEQTGTTVADQMQNRTDIRYALNWEKGRFEIGGGYDYNYYIYHGVSPYLPDFFQPTNLSSRNFMRDSLSHAYSLYKADFSLSSFKSIKEGAEWGLSFGWSRLEDNTHLWGFYIPTLKENLIRFRGEVAMRFHREHKFGLSLFGSFSNNLRSSEFDRGIFAFHPFYQINKDRFSFTAGVILSGTFNYIKGFEKSGSFFLYPNAEISYQVILNNLGVYAQVSGETRHNDYQTLLTENPWLSQDLELRFGDIPLMTEAGIKGKVANHLGFNIYGQYIKTNNQHYFYNQRYFADLRYDGNPPHHAPLYNLFDLEYASEKRLSAVAELNWDSSPLSLHLIGKMHSYTLSTGWPAWNKPKTELNFFARYQWRERIVAIADLSYRGEVFAIPCLNPNGVYLDVDSRTYPTKIDGFTDIGFKLEYRFASWFGLYAEVKNLLDSKKQPYLLYYEPGRQIGGGVTLRL